MMCLGCCCFYSIPTPVFYGFKNVFFLNSKKQSRDPCYFPTVLFLLVVCWLRPDHRDKTVSAFYPPRVCFALFFFGAIDYDNRKTWGFLLLLDRGSFVSTPAALPPGR